MHPLSIPLIRRGRRETGANPRPRDTPWTGRQSIAGLT